MKKFRVFISSVQGEFANERKALAAYLKEDPLLGSFFIPFIFEEEAACANTPSDIYLGEVSNSDIYIGILGEKYGYENADGISATESEYSTARIKNLPRWIYIKDTDSGHRHPKEQAFIQTIEKEVTRKTFTDTKSLLQAVYHSAVVYLKQTGKITSTDFDNGLNDRAGIQDIDTVFLTDFVVIAREKRNFTVKKTSGPEEILSHLKMFREGKLVNSALLVFGSDPQHFFPSATIKCAHFHGTQIQKPIPDFKEYCGNVFHMAEGAVDFILSKISLSIGSRDKSNFVETTYEIPRAVIAEAVINAIAHRDYYSSGSIQISVFSDRIEISNPGKLPPELTIEKLKLPHGSYPHNPILAESMFLYGAIERFGTGMLDIFGKTRNNGLKEPDIILHEGFKIVFYRPSPATDQPTDQPTDQVIVQTFDSTVQEYKNNLNLVHRLILTINQEMSRQELMEKLSLKHIPTFRTNYLKPAQEQGLIEMTYPDKPNWAHQKYKLTLKGITLKNRLLSNKNSDKS